MTYPSTHTYIDQIRGKHAQVLIEELNLAIIDPLGNFFSDLVRATALNHVQASPSILRLCAGRGTHEEGIFELALQVVLLDVVCECGGNHPMVTMRISRCYVSYQTETIHAKNVEHEYEIRTWDSPRP